MVMKTNGVICALCNIICLKVFLLGKLSACRQTNCFTKDLNLMTIPHSDFQVVFGLGADMTQPCLLSFQSKHDLVCVRRNLCALEGSELRLMT